jgi:hypothetical protein
MWNFDLLPSFRIKIFFMSDVLLWIINGSDMLWFLFACCYAVC